MATIIEDYCDFETAKLLKEKGFDGCCTQLYNLKKQIERGTWPQTVKHDGAYLDKNGYILCPTLQMAMKWLREVYGLHVWVEYSRFDFNKEHPYLWNIAETKIDGDYWGGSYHKHPEKAVEEAIRYCIENLI